MNKLRPSLCCDEVSFANKIFQPSSFNLEATEERPHLVAVSLEFDASSVKSGVQHGVIESDATYHLLVHRQQHIMDFESSL